MQTGIWRDNRKIGRKKKQGKTKKDDVEAAGLVAYRNISIRNDTMQWTDMITNATCHGQ